MMKYLTLIFSLLLGAQTMADDTTPPHKPATEALAIFAGGCFWCLEPPFDQVQGVHETVVGYSGGKTEHPTYEKISTGTTGHREVIAVHYDPTVTDFTTLLEVFLANIDPFDPHGQYVDKGYQYTTAIHYETEAEKQAAEAALKALAEKTDKTPVVKIEPIATFYPAEEYHQDYYQKNPLRYGLYKKGSGR